MAPIDAICVLFILLLKIVQIKLSDIFEGLAVRVRANNGMEAVYKNEKHCYSELCDLCRDYTFLSYGKICWLKSQV